MADKYITSISEGPKGSAATVIRKDSKWGKIYGKRRDDTMDYYREKHGMEGLDSSMRAAAASGARKTADLAEKSANYDKKRELAKAMAKSK